MELAPTGGSAQLGDEYQRNTHDADAADTVASMNRVIDMMRTAVAAVQVAGEVAQG